MRRFERIGCVRCHNRPKFSDYKLHVLDFYDDVDSRRGDDRNANVSREELDPLLRQLRSVDDDDEDLLAFLEEALSDPGFDRTIPLRVPSGLPVGGRIQ